MARPTDIDDDDLEVVPVALDSETRAWLVRIADETGNHPARIAAAILHDVRKDDLAAHGRTLN